MALGFIRLAKIICQSLLRKNFKKIFSTNFWAIHSPYVDSVISISPVISCLQETQGILGRGIYTMGSENSRKPLITRMYVPRSSSDLPAFITFAPSVSSSGPLLGAALFFGANPARLFTPTNSELGAHRNPSGLYFGFQALTTTTPISPSRLAHHDQ